MIGQTVSHYKITDELGAGGMGVVYRAEDTQLDRTVALKFLPAHLKADETSKARFIQEAKAASALEDDNICTIHEIGETGDGQLFIVMAYYEGRTLKENLSTAPGNRLDRDEAMGIAARIASGLTAAHDRGVVHRDIKPANIMLPSRGGVKILDFGLAKLGAASDLTKEGSTLGTTMYMSPEQARGHEVGAASDVWSLGIVLYQMLTGKTPFGGEYDQAIIYGILNEEASAPSSQASGITNDVDQLISQCLAKDPDHRISMAQLAARLSELAPRGQTVIRAAETAAVGSSAAPMKVGAVFAVVSAAVLALVYFAMMQFGLPGWIMPTSVVLLLLGLPITIYASHLDATQEGRWLTRRRALMGGVLAFSGLGLTILLFVASRITGVGPGATLMSSGAMTAEDEIIVAAFDNQTDDARNAEAVTAALEIDLAESNVVRLFSGTRLREALSRMDVSRDTVVTSELAIHLAVREGIKAVLQGEVTVLGGGFIISARLVSSETGETLVPVREEAIRPDDIIPAVDRLSAKLRERVGESLRTIRAEAPLQQVTTGSLEALRLYSRAIREMEELTREEEVDLLRQAVDLDSTFAMAYRRIAARVVNDPAGRREAVLAAYRHRNRLSESERNQVEGVYHFTITHDLSQAQRSFREVLRINPDDFIANINLALAYNLEGRFEEATPHAIHGAKHELGRIGDAALSLTSLNRFDSLRTLLDETATIRPADDIAYVRVGVEILERNFDTALAIADSSSDLSRDGRGEFEILIPGIRGQIQQSFERTEELMQQVLDEGNLTFYHNMMLFQSFVRFQLGDREEGERLLDQTLSVAPLDSIPVSNWQAGSLVPVLVSAGRMDEARAIATAFDTTYVRDAVWVELGRNHITSLINAWIATGEGRVDDAIEHFENIRSNYGGCPPCEAFHLGRLYEQKGEEDFAIDAYLAATTTHWGRDYQYWNDFLGLAQSYESLGRLYDRRGEWENAAEYYTKFIELWENADDFLQPRVDAARERLDAVLVEAAREPSS